MLRGIKHLKDLNAQRTQTLKGLKRLEDSNKAKGLNVAKDSNVDDAKGEGNRWPQPLIYSHTYIYIDCGYPTFALFHVFHLRACHITTSSPNKPHIHEYI